MRGALWFTFCMIYALVLYPVAFSFLVRHSREFRDVVITGNEAMNSWIHRVLRLATLAIIMAIGSQFIPLW